VTIQDYICIVVSLFERYFTVKSELKNRKNSSEIKSSKKNKFMIVSDKNFRGLETMAEDIYENDVINEEEMAEEIID